MEALGIAASVVGVVGPALRVVRQLLDDIDKIVEAPRTISSLKDDLLAIDQVLASYERVTTAQWRSLGDPLAKQAEAAILSCVEPCNTIRSALQRRTRQAGKLSWKDRAVIGFFRQSKYKSMSEQLQNCKATLTLLAANAGFLKNMTTTVTPSGCAETPPTPFPMIPFSRDPEFVNRGDIVDQIARQCSQSPYRVALVGLGGVGKSQLAIEYAHSVSEANNDIWVLWVYAETRARVEDSFKTVADMAKLPGRNDQGADIFQIVYTWLASPRSGKWLMILDSADHEDVFYGITESGQTDKLLASYLPQNPNGSIVITTRDRSLACRLTGHDLHLIPIGPMSEMDALTLFERRLETLSDPDRSMALDLVRALDLVPLAISQAAAFIRQRRPRTSVEKYLEEFRKGDSKQAWLLGHDAGDLRRDGAASNSVLTTWAISFREIRRKRPSAAHLLSLMSFFDRQGIPEEVLRPSKRAYLAKLSWSLEKQYEDPDVANDPGASDTGGDGSQEDKEVQDGAQEESEFQESVGQQGHGATHQDDIASHHEVDEPRENDSCEDDRFEDDVEMLRSFSLISVEEEGDMFEMHGLVQLSTRRWLTADGQHEALKLEFIERLTVAFPEANTYLNKRLDSWRAGQRLLPHAEVALRYASASQAPAVLKKLLRSAAWYTHRLGTYDVSERLCRASISVQAPKGEIDMVPYLLALLLCGKGQFREAEIVTAEAVSTAKTLLGPDHQTTGRYLSTLSQIYTAECRYSEAEELQKQLEENHTKMRGPDHKLTLDVMVLRARTLRGAGRWEEAKSLLMHVMEAFTRKYGLDYLKTRLYMCDLAVVLLSQGRGEQAEAILTQEAETSKTELGADHPRTLYILGMLGRSMQAQGKSAEAEQLLVQVVGASKQQLGLDHRDTLIRMASLASVLTDQGRLDGADEINQEIMKAAERRGGADTALFLFYSRGQARVRLEQGRLQEAEELLTRTTETTKTKLGAEHPNTLEGLRLLSYTWWLQGRKVDALRLLERVVEGRQRVLGLDHPHTRWASDLLEEWKTGHTIERSEDELTTSSLSPH